MAYTRSLLVGMAILSLLLCGFLMGRIVSMHLYEDESPIRVVKDAGNTIPTVNIFGLQDGRVRGSIQGDVRVLIAEQSANPRPDGSFDVSAGSFFINYVSIKIPDGMKFVASKTGKKYYSVTSGNGERIAPENRVYFKTAIEAENAGYSK